MNSVETYFIKTKANLKGVDHLKEKRHKVIGLLMVYNSVRVVWFSKHGSFGVGQR